LSRARHEALGHGALGPLALAHGAPALEHEALRHGAPRLRALAHEAPVDEAPGHSAQEPSSGLGVASMVCCSGAI
jgi:hypothetical protein